MGTFGWTGEVKVYPETDFPQRFKELRDVWIETPNGKQQKCRVENAHVSARRIRLKFAEYSSKEEAAVLRDSLILIPEEELVSLPEDRFFLHQILGLAVHSTEGKHLGEITEIIRAPGNDVYVTEHADIPARREVVKEIDLERGIMVVDTTSIQGIVEQ